MENVEGTDAEPLAKMMVPPFVRLMVLPGATVVATPAVSAVIVPPVVMVPTVPVLPVLGTVIWLLPVALGGSVMAELAGRVTKAMPLALTFVETVVATWVGSAASVPLTPGTNPPTARPSGTVLGVVNVVARAALCAAC